MDKYSYIKLVQKLLLQLYKDLNLFYQMATVKNIKQYVHKYQKYIPLQ